MTDHDKGANLMMRFSRRNVCFKIIFLVLVGVLVATSNSVYAGGSEEKTYIEFIIDASGSMREKVEGNQSRMDVAKEVLKELVEGLDDDPMLEIALRVYGFQLPGKSSCEDSGLMQGFGPVGKVRSSILQIVESLSPKGMTPIGYSLKEAAKDFPKGKDSRNVIVLVTDGEESCMANPCAISQQLQKDGIILKPYVVGFALSAAAEEKVRCIGNYFSAKDKASLSDALKSIMVEVVAAPSLEVEAWADGKNVTAKTDIQVLDSSGKPVAVEVKAKAGEVLKLSAAEGVYTVTGKFIVDNEPVEVSQANVNLKGGQTTRVRLDFGDMTGKIVLYAEAGGKAIPPSALAARVYRDGKDRGQLLADGDGLSIKVSAGIYDLRCDYSSVPKQSLGVEGIEVKRGEVKKVELTFQRPGRIRVKTIVDGKPSDQVDVKLHQNGKFVGDFEKVQGERGVFEVGVLEGSYDILATPKIAGFSPQWMNGVAVKAGETVNKEIVISSTKIRVKLIMDGKPYHAPDYQTRVMVYHAGTTNYVCDLEEIEKGVFERQMKEGLYDLELVNIGTGIADKWMRDQEVRSGETLEKIVNLGGKGKIRIKLIADGKPYSDPEAGTRVIVSEAGTDGDEYVFDLEETTKGVFEQEIKEGMYDLCICNLGPAVGFGEKWIRDVEISGGETFERIIDLGSKSDVKFKVTLNGDPCTNDDIRVMVYDVETGDYVRDLEETLPGFFEGELMEGVYDIEITNYSESYWMRGVEITGGRLDMELNLTDEDLEDW
jgi:Ca-activated chloride channel family protein